MISSANGGVGSFTFNLARNLGDSVETVDLYLYKDASRDVPAGDFPENVNVVVESSGRLQFGLELLRATPRLKNYDVIHSVILSPYIIFLKSLPYSDVKTVNTVHPQPVLSKEDVDLRSLLNESYQKAEKKTQPALSRISDATVTVSEDSAELVREEWGIDPYVVHHGVDDSRFAPAIDGHEEIREELGVSEEETLFMFVGILYPKKDVATLIDSIPKILEADEDCKFLIVGRGPEEELLRKKVNQNGVGDHVIHRSYVEDINRFYSAADVFVLPSYIEEFGIVYVEAMQSGLPVVAADIDVAREVVADGGVFFEPQDPTSLSDEIIGILENRHLVEQLSDNGIERAKMFNWENAAEEYVEIYEEITDEE